uniref:Uncharacterized protein n=1 Tax=Arundo donax TaxID=35708 RepID=A0A0A8XZ05_ARUDO
MLYRLIYLFLTATFISCNVSFCLFQ